MPRMGRIEKGDAFIYRSALWKQKGKEHHCHQSLVRPISILFATRIAASSSL